MVTLPLGPTRRQARLSIRNARNPARAWSTERAQEIGTVTSRSYLSWFETDVNVLVSLVPRVVIAAIAATAIRAAMRPYSLAVAPDSSRAKRLKRVFMWCSCPSPTAVKCGGTGADFDELPLSERLR